MTDGVIKNIDSEIPFAVPKLWEYKRISSICKIVMGSSPEGTTINTESLGVEFHQGKICFTDMYIAKSDKFTTAPTKIAEKNSVLLCVRAPVGATNITEREICIGRGLSAIKPYSNINLFFIYYYLNAYKNKLVLQGTGSTFSAITADTVNSILIPVPPLNEQTRIISAIKKLFELIDNIKSSLE